MSLTTAQLPVRLTPLVGRDSELDEIVHAVARTRLVTLTGPGGTGKTRLALAAARAALAGPSRPGCAGWSWPRPKTPAWSGTPWPGGWACPTRPGRTPAEAAASYIADHQLLVVLDNCEHLAGAAASLTEDLLAPARP